MVITSRQNSVVRYFSSLNDKKYRRQYNAYLIEGVKSVAEAQKAGVKILKMLCTPHLAEEFPQADVVSEELFCGVSCEKTPQGVIAAAEIPQADLRPPQSSCILLDGLQDPGNIGTIIRTANAAGYDEIYLADCADAYSPKVVRASMSGIFFVKVYRCTRAQALELLEGIPKIAADMGGQNVFGFKPPQKFCLCIGNEGNGISAETLNAANYTVKIPMRASCESLNAAVSAGIAMYALKNNMED